MIPHETETHQGQATAFVWKLTGTDDGECSPAALPGFSDCTVQVFGDFHENRVEFQGTNSKDQQHWQTLNGGDGLPLVFTEAGLRVLAENALYVRPSCSIAADTAITVILLARRQK